MTDPTMTSLTVNWDPADGAVRLYKVFFVPATGGLEEMVSPFYGRKQVRKLLERQRVRRPAI